MQKIIISFLASLALMLSTLTFSGKTQPTSAEQALHKSHVNPT